MTETLQIYKCEICGNIVEVLHAGRGELVCCGQPMKLYKENKTDAAREKHVPVISKEENGYRITIGSVLHPMEDKHYIEWIELIADGTVHRKSLKPGDKPEVFFNVTGSSVRARAYCNIHGLWEA
ncbi:MAG: desulfoferrodoxin [Spirochaetes bacterium]|nr:desulfoferrodoxin [Spirochaetota bacterium]